MAKDKQEEITLPGALILMGSLMLRATLSDQAWQKYDFSEISDHAFRVAAKFYVDGHPDHALLEIFRLMEAYLQAAGAFLGFSSTDKPEKVERLINGLKDKKMLSDGDAFLLHGFRAYRNVIAHSWQPDIHGSTTEALMLLSVPLLMQLEQIVGIAALPKVIEWLGKLGSGTT